MSVKKATLTAVGVEITCPECDEGLTAPNGSYMWAAYEYRAVAGEDVECDAPGSRCGTAWRRRQAITPPTARKVPGRVSPLRETAGSGVAAELSPPAPVLCFTIDPARLARAVALKATKLGPGRYRVEGGSRPHDVDVSDPSAPVCRCEDRVRGACKHILAALICEGEPTVTAAAQALVSEVFP